MIQHEPYELLKKRPCDFVVKYRFFTEEETGSGSIEHAPGFSSGFLYYGEDPNTDGVYSVCPEFLDDENHVITDDTRIPWNGKAKMWVADPGSIHYHRERIRVGLKGFFVEDNQKVAVCEVIRIEGFGCRQHSEVDE